VDLMSGCGAGVSPAERLRRRDACTTGKRPRTMKRLLLGLVVVVAVSAAPLAGSAPQQDKAKTKLLIAFSSYKDRPKHPNIFFYEHDGVASGKVIGAVGTPRNVASADARPALAHDGRFCVFTHEIENKTSRVYCWDLKEQKLVDLPGLN